MDGSGDLPAEDAATLYNHAAGAFTAACLRTLVGEVFEQRAPALPRATAASKEKDSPRVGEVRAACRRAGKSVVTLSRSSLLTLSRLRTCSKYRGDRSGPPPHPRFRSVHWRSSGAPKATSGRGGEIFLVSADFYICSHPRFPTQQHAIAACCGSASGHSLI